ncbi:MAG: hypothetical protein EAZ30_02520 [Betaproteobacteria bacterium]|nr:MAG: hypothetical protein EAZ30_02520 [Betaproteobacteria bacterium]
MKSVFSFTQRRFAVTLTASITAFASMFVNAQVVLQKPPLPSGPISVPNKLPPQLLPDLMIDMVTGSSAKAYAAKIKNVGAIPSPASNIYCAATVSNATEYYTIEYQQAIPALNVNATHTASCDFGSGAKSVKPGEKLVAVNFVVNNGKVIKESNYANNGLRTNVN